MKKILFAAMVLLMVVGCSTGYEPENDSSQQPDVLYTRKALDEAVSRARAECVSGNTAATLVEGSTVTAPMVTDELLTIDKMIEESKEKLREYCSMPPYGGCEDIVKLVNSRNPIAANIPVEKYTECKEWVSSCIPLHTETP